MVVLQSPLSKPYSHCDCVEQRGGGRNCGPRDIIKATTVPSGTMQLSSWFPTKQFLKLNIDGSFGYKTRRGGVEGLFRANKGNCIKGFHACVSVNSQFEAEVTALYFGLSISMRMNCDKLIIATDSMLHTSVCSNELVADTNLIAMCRDLLQMLGSPHLCHEGRHSIKAADSLTREGRKMKEWTVPPLFIHRIIELDKEGTSFIVLVLLNMNNL